EADVVADPIQVVAAGGTTRARRCEAGVRGHAPVTPIAADLLGELRMKREAAPRQLIKGAPVAPVEREEAARLARCRARDPHAFDHGSANAAAAQEISDRRADDAAAADQHMHIRTISNETPSTAE